jgi:hypothetical protein
MIIHTKFIFTTLLGQTFEREVHIRTKLAQEIDANNKLPQSIVIVGRYDHMGHYVLDHETTEVIGGTQTPVGHYKQQFGYVLESK